MPQLTELTEAMRVVAVLEVSRLLHLNPDMKITEACDQAGISLDQYYFWRNRDGGESARLFRQLYNEVAQYSLQLTTAARIFLLEQLIRDAISPLTEIKDRLAIYKTIAAENTALVQEYGSSGAEDEAADFLRGPATKPAPNKFTASVSEDEDGITVTTHIPKAPVIDITERDTSDSQRTPILSSPHPRLPSPPEGNDTGE